jgi:hypothetical protein
VEVATGNPLFGLFQKARENGIIDGPCRACSAKMGTTNDADAMGLALLDDMSGHPGMSRYMAAGYDIVIF